MITITRRLAQQLRSVLRRAFGTIRGKSPAIAFIADREGLTVRSMFGDVAVELHVPGERPADALCLPFEFLADCEGKRDDLIELATSDNNRVTAQWQDRGIPQLLSYDVPPDVDADKFPSMPSDFATNPSGLLQALHEASEITTPDNVRFALGRIQLCSNGTINTTDGRQALMQSGFAFPWSEPMLIPSSKVFRSAELAKDRAVLIGQSDGWAAISVEPWTIYLRIDTEGRFPNIAQIVRQPADAKARCLLSPQDSQFLADTLPRLPSSDENNLPVTLDLNGHVAIRAKGMDHAKPTEVVLANSSCTGEATRIAVNRTYLGRALRLGVQDICLFGDNTALLGLGENRKYFWMPLEPGAVIEPAEDVVPIESPKGEPATIVTPTVTPQEVPPMSEPTTNTMNANAATNGQAKVDAKPKASRRKADQQNLAALIDQAVEFRSSLHGLMQEANGLVKALKQHRRQNKAIQNTLDSLKQLKTLGV